MSYVQYKTLDIWIDEEDVKYLAKYNYTVCGEYLRRRYSALHRDIMKCPRGMEVDHINGNKRDNRKQNLRIVTHAENHNGFHSLNKNNTSGCQGVHWNSRDKVWIASISSYGKRIHLGSTDDFFEACCLRKSAENRYRNNT